MREIRGDIFRPSLLTDAAISRQSRLSSSTPLLTPALQPPEPPISNPQSPYVLDPNRGVADINDDRDGTAVSDEAPIADIVPVDDVLNDPGLDHSAQESIPATTRNEIESVVDQHDRAITQAAELVEARNSMNSGYSLPNTTQERHSIYSALTIKEARTLYGDSLIDAASIEELKTCIQKEVWECLDPDYPLRNAIPSKMFLTPKKLPNGDIDKIKGRIVAGGHRQDRSLFNDNEISSSTVALTSVLEIGRAHV